MIPYETERVRLFMLMTSAAKCPIICCTYIYICVYIYIHIHLYIYILYI